MLEPSEKTLVVRMDVEFPNDGGPTDVEPLMVIEAILDQINPAVLIVDRRWFAVAQTSLEAEWED